MPFKVYRCRRFQKFYPLIIVTSGKEQNTIFSEFFLLIRENDNEHYFPLKIWKHGLSKEFEGIGLTEDFMIEQALNSCKGELYNFLFNKFTESNPNGIFNFDLELIIFDDTELLASHLQGEFNKAFEKILLQTNSKELREYLIKILKLRKFQSTNEF